jgi:hypothetical protein
VRSTRPLLPRCSRLPQCSGQSMCRQAVALHRHLPGAPPRTEPSHLMPRRSPAPMPLGAFPPPHGRCCRVLLPCCSDNHAKTRPLPELSHPCPPHFVVGCCCSCLSCSAPAMIVSLLPCCVLTPPLSHPGSKNRTEVSIRVPRMFKSHVPLTIR